MGFGVSSLRKYKLKERRYQEAAVDWIADPIRDGKYIRKKKIAFEDFEKVCFLKNGASANVYLCKHKKTGKYYALKAIKKIWIFDNRRFDHVRREINIQLSLTRRVSNLFRVFENHSYVYLVLEYCVLGDIENLLKKNGRFSLSVIKFFILEIVDALKYLHETRSIIHRHIRPDNVMLSATGHVKLIDFGNAIKVTRQEPVAKTIDKDITGLLDFTAPELIPPSEILKMQIEHNPTRFHSFPVDYWSLGVLIFHMACRKFPFGQDKANTYSRVAAKVLKGKRRNMPFYLYFRYRNSGILELINGLIRHDQESRWGYEEIMSSKFMSRNAVGEKTKVNVPYLPHSRLVPADNSSFGKLKKRQESEDERPLLSEDEYAYTFFSKVIEEEMFKASLSAPGPKLNHPLVKDKVDITEGDITEFGDKTRPEEWVTETSTLLRQKKQKLNKRIRKRIFPEEEK